MSARCPSSIRVTATDLFPSARDLARHDSPELKAVHSEGGDLPLSTFFDLASLSYYSNVSLVEWRDVKIGDTAGTQSETLSCWGWRDESPLARYNIKTWFWPPPGQLTVPSSIETSMTFPAIEVLVSQEQTKWLEETAERYFGSMDNAPPLPDKQLLCFENLFYGEGRRASVCVSSRGLTYRTIACSLRCAPHRLASPFDALRPRHARLVSRDRRHVAFRPSLVNSRRPPPFQRRD